MAFSLFKKKNSSDPLTLKKCELFKQNRAAFHKALVASSCPYPDQTKEQISFYQNRLIQLNAEFQQTSDDATRDTLEKAIKSTRSVLALLESNINQYNALDEGKNGFNK